jgi:hypothetical protein
MLRKKALSMQKCLQMATRLKSSVREEKAPIIFGTMYSGDPKTRHLNSGHIRKPDRTFLTASLDPFLIKQIFQDSFMYKIV